MLSVSYRSRNKEMIRHSLCPPRRYQKLEQRLQGFGRASGFREQEVACSGGVEAFVEEEGEESLEKRLYNVS